MNEKDYITLYPTNWLYNAGVVGFLGCLDRNDYLQDDNNIGSRYDFKEGIVKVNKDIFERIKVEDNYFENGKVINLKGKNLYYPNFLDVSGNQKDVFIYFVNLLSDQTIDSECHICSMGKNIKESKIKESKQKDQFLKKINELNMVHNKLLGPSDKFPNAYWNLYDKMKICHVCSFIFIHHHLAFTKLSDGSEIFINAPSFEVMYKLNKLVKEIFGTNGDSKKKREILAMSLIEYARRVQITLGQWTAMNIEIVIKRNNIIDFYSLPYETTQLISDKSIASLLSDIGEIAILNAVLDGNYHDLLHIAQKLIQISMKDNKNKSDSEYINNQLKRQNNKNDLSTTSYKILKLHALIKERRKRYGTN